ncbi:MAG: SCO family protein [Phycisphaerae bacterium]
MRPATGRQGDKMKQRRRWMGWVSGLIGLTLVVGSVRAQTTRPAVLKDVGIDQKLDAQVALDLPFRDEAGAPVRLGDYFHDKPVILTLVYYRCPMLCTLVLDGLLRSLKPLGFAAGRDFQIVTVSFDPREGPELAKAKKSTYLQRYGQADAATGWHFLTGDEDAIRKLTDAVGFRYTYDEKTDQFAHASAIMVLTPAGKVSKYFYGIDYSTKDLRLGLVEASENRIGTRADELMLLCFHYDPTTGKYGLAVTRVLRVLGALTVLGLGSFMLFANRRSRRRRAAADAAQTKEPVG